MLGSALIVLLVAGLVSGCSTPREPANSTPHEPASAALTKNACAALLGRKGVSEPFRRGLACKAWFFREGNAGNSHPFIATASTTFAVSCGMIGLRMSRKLRKPKSRFVQRLFAARVTAEDLKRAISAVNALPPEDRGDLTARSVAMLREFSGPPGQGPHDEAAAEESLADSDRITAVQFRLEALARLSNDQKFRGWSMPSDSDEMMFISGEVLEAAAKETLLEDGNRPAFNPESFFLTLLTLTKEDGKA